VSDRNDIERMLDDDDDGTLDAAFPTARNMGGGLTKDEYAAIHLRVEGVGLSWLDEMIFVSLRDSFAMAAMQGLCSDERWDPVFAEQTARMAYMQADAMLEARKK